MSESEKQGGSKAEFDFLIFQQVLKKSWHWSLIFVFIFVGLAFVYLRYTKPVYESSMIIQLDTKEEGEQVLEIDLKSNASSEKLSENVELLQSTFLLRRALNKLPLKVSYFNAGEILQEEKYQSSGYDVRLLHITDSSRYNCSYQVVSLGENTITLSYLGNKKTYELNKPVITKFATFDIQITDRSKLMGQLNENQVSFRVNKLDKLAKQYANSVAVQVINPEAKTIRLAFRSFNARLSKDVVNSVNQTFNEFDLERRSKSSQSILNFINNQIDTVYSSLKNSEQKIQNFKKSAKLKDPEKLSSTLQEKLNLFENELIKLQIENNLLGQVKRQVKSKITKNDLFDLMPALAGSRYEEVLRPEFEELKKSILQKETMLTSMTTKNKSLKEINRVIDVQKAMIQSTVSTIKEKNAERKKYLEEKISELDSEFYSLPEKEMKLARLQRVFELNEKYYNLLLEKRTQYSIAKAGFTPSNRVLEPASINSSPVSPNKELILLAALFAGFFLSLLMVVWRYLRFDKIPDEKTLKRWLPEKVGYLGNVPKVKTGFGPSKMRIGQEPKSRLTESLRSIRTNLEFIDHQGSRLIGITSTTSGEGKTFVSANLAGVLAITGKKVLIVDYDLRKPKLHLAFNDESTEAGVSSIISGKMNWQDCVRSTELESLYYIPAGHTPPNPSEMIGSENNLNMIKELKENFDEIIFDTPPVGLVSDGVRVLNLTDLPIYIFRANYSKKTFLDELNNIHDFDKIKTIYIILNGEVHTAKKYGYGYGYYYQEKSGFWKIFKRKK